MWTSILLHLLLSTGAQAAGPGDVSELLLEARTARRLTVEVGDTVRAAAPGGGERAFRVTGIYRRPADPATVTLEDYRVILHLPDLQQLTGSTDRVDRFTLKLHVGANRESVLAEIDRLAYGAEAYPTERVANTTSETFRVISRFHRALAGVTIVGSAIFLLCLVVLKIEERQLEGATMREIGISRRTLFLWTFGETLAMALIGTGAGVLAGWAGSYLINAYFRSVYDTTLAFARVTPELAFRAAGIALITGVVIGIWAGWRMVRSSPGRLRGS